jgi:RNA polymerase sigma-70 factor (ECF subfamily)
MTPLRELQLVDAYRQGGRHAREAMGELLWGYQRRIYSICYRMLKHPEDAGDVTQDVLLKIMEGLESYDGRSKLSTWVIRVTINCCLSFLRREKV